MTTLRCYNAGRSDKESVVMPANLITKSLGLAFVDTLSSSGVGHSDNDVSRTRPDCHRRPGANSSRTKTIMSRDPDHVSTSSNDVTAVCTEEPSSTRHPTFGEMAAAVGILLPVAISLLCFLVSHVTPMDSNSTALLIIDVQNCFTAGGSLAVPGGNDVIPIINRLRASSLFGVIALTKDWHTPQHVSFASSHPGQKAYDVINLTYTQNGSLCKPYGSVNCSGSGLRSVSQRLWPDHCVANTNGADLCADLVTSSDLDLIVYKGHNNQVDSYSAFYDNGRISETDLNLRLRNLNVTSVYLVGLATDYCVYESAKDSKQLGYKTYVILDATRGVSPGTTENAIADMQQKGIILVNSADVLGSTAAPVRFSAATLLTAAAVYTIFS